MGCATPYPIHWQDLRAHPRKNVLQKPGVRSRPNDFGFEASFLNASYWVDSNAERIVEIKPNSSRILSPAFQILLIRYLTAPEVCDPVGEWISEKELPGGATFFRGPHRLLVEPLVERFCRDPEEIKARGQELEAQFVDHGDCALCFFPFPTIPVIYVLWSGDEDFPASGSVLFDGSIVRWFSLDMIFLLVQQLILRIVE